MKTRSTAICVALLVVAISTPSWAVPITFAFSGTITRVRNDYGRLDNSVVIDGQFSGFYTFESSVTDSDPDQHYGYYSLNALPSAISVQVGSYSVLGTLDYIRVEDGAKDIYGATSSNINFMGMNTILGLGLTDLGATMLTSDALLLAPPSLTNLPPYLREISLVGRQYETTQFGIGGTLDSLVLIPEPAVIMLFLPGIGLAGARFRRQTR